MISLKEARIIWANKRLNYINLIEPTVNDGGQLDLTPDEETQKLSREIDNFARAIYSMPHIKNHMSCWMVDIKFGDEIPECFRKENGSCGNITVEHVENLMKDPQKFTDMTGGPLLSSISNDIKELELTITDRGFGGCGGHIGVPCSDVEKDALINMIWFKYRSAIDNRLIFPVISWFKPKFDDLWHREQIESFLEWQ